MWNVFSKILNHLCTDIPLFIICKIAHGSGKTCLRLCGLSCKDGKDGVHSMPYADERRVEYKIIANNAYHSTPQSLASTVLGDKQARYEFI